MADYVVRSGARSDSYYDDYDDAPRPRRRYADFDDDVSIQRVSRGGRNFDEDGFPIRRGRGYGDDDLVPVRVSNSPLHVKVDDDPPAKHGFWYNVTHSLPAAGAFALGVVGAGMFWDAGLHAFGGSHSIAGYGGIGSIGHNTALPLAAAGVAAMFASGALLHWLLPKK